VIFQPVIKSAPANEDLRAYPSGRQRIERPVNPLPERSLRHTGVLLECLQIHPLIWAYGYAPSEMIVGDPIQVRIKGNNMYLQKPRGGELKTSIIRRERIAADKKPITCALPVATGD